MERRVEFDANEQGTVEDFNNLGLFPQATFDDIGLGLLIPDLAYWGFGVSAVGSTSLQVARGSIIVNGQCFVNDDAGGTQFNLLSGINLPVAAQRYITLVGWGTTEDTNTVPRAFLTDVNTRAIEAQVIPTVSLRRANLAIIPGIESPNPLPPTPAANQVAICNILLDTSGIVSNGGIMMNLDNLAPNLRSLDVLAQMFDLWRIRIGQLVDTLASDLANLAGRINGLATRDLVVAAISQIAQIKDKVGLPSTYSAWAADNFLDYTYSDTLDADFLALVQDGIRFPFAQEQIAQLGLLNSIDPTVMVQNNFMLPAYTLVPRVSVLGNDGEISISSIPFQTLTCIKKAIARTRTRFGVAFAVCTNSSFWETGVYDPATNVFTRQGETYTVLSGDTAHNHKWLRVEEFWIDEWLEYYWDCVTTTNNYPGSILAETFLNSQEGWLCAVDLYFTRVAASGDVQVLVCETNVDGSPNHGACIAQVTLPVANIHTYPTATRVLLQPTALKAGTRYAVILISPGNHYLSTVNGNKYTSGTLFTSTDSVWFSGDLLNDVAFQLVFARFNTPWLAVAMQPLQLPLGIANIDINADTVCPAADGFQLIHQYQDPVSGIWTSMGADGAAALIGLPVMLSYRIVFVGTPDMMPGIGLGVNSEAYTWRPRSDFKHVSKERDMPGASSTVNTVYVNLRLEAWRGDIANGGHHTCVPKLKYGSGFNSLKLGSWVDSFAQDDPSGGTIYRRAVFVFSPAVHSYKVEIVGTTDNVVACYHVAGRVDIGLVI